MNEYLTQFSSYSLKNLGNRIPSIIYIQNRPRVFFSDPGTPLTYNLILEYVACNSYTNHYLLYGIYNVAKYTQNHNKVPVRA